MHVKLDNSFVMNDVFEIEELDVSDELHVKKNENITHNNCILTEPDNVDVKKKSFEMKRFVKGGQMKVEDTMAKTCSNEICIKQKIIQQEQERRSSSSQASTSNHCGHRSEASSSNRMS